MIAGQASRNMFELSQESFNRPSTKELRRQRDQKLRPTFKVGPRPLFFNNLKKMFSTLAWRYLLPLFLTFLASECLPISIRVSFMDVFQAKLFHWHDLDLRWHSFNVEQESRKSKMAEHATEKLKDHELTTTLKKFTVWTQWQRPYLNSSNATLSFH